jgi:hypothetical protein
MCGVMSGPASSYFEIVPRVGCLTRPPSPFGLQVVGFIDLLKHPQYESINLTVWAEDSHGARGVAYVYITVKRVNYYDPLFAPTTYTGSIDGEEVLLLLFMCIIALCATTFTGASTDMTCRLHYTACTWFISDWQKQIMPKAIPASPYFKTIICVPQSVNNYL